MNKATILVVEDEAIVAADLSSKLKQIGYEVVGTAATGEDGVAMAASLQPQLVLMDISLKGEMDGVEAAVAIREHDVPVIYLTAHSDPATLARAKITEPFGYIIKPFDERELAAQIELGLYKHQADREIRKQREWLRVTLRSIGDAVIATDAEERVTFINPIAESLTGWTAEESAGRLLADIYRVVNERTGEPLDEPVAKVLREGRPVALANHAALINKNGHTVPVEDSAAPILDAANRVIGAVLVFHDVTESRRAQDALEAARQSAEQAEAAAQQANRAKDRFLAMLSHELRTPLTPVVMAVSMLQQRMDLPEDVRQTLETIRRNVEMEARLIDDLLDVTRITSGKVRLERKPVQLGPVIHRAIEVCKAEMERQELSLETDIEPDTASWVNADVPRLQQVFCNLLQNAIKFTPQNGRVAVRCWAEEQDAVVEVADSGIGMESVALTRVFNEFEQASPSITQRFGGLGLGLAITKALVEMHGGRIEADSQGQDLGSTFRVRLPTTAPATSVARATEKSLQAVTPSLRILLVEDDADTAQMTRKLLTLKGHRVAIADNLAKALELADCDEFDLLISDLGLPDGSGHELMRQLRRAGYRFPGVALSGYGQDEDVRESHAAGFAAHLTKPVSYEALMNAVAATPHRPERNETEHGQG